MPLNELGSSRPLFTKDIRRDVYPFIEPIRPELVLNDKVVLVTGAGRGIGVSIVEAFAKAHVKAIILVGRSELRLTSTKEKFNELYPEVELVVVAIDVGIPESVDDMFNKLKAKFSHIDVLVHNAGVLNDYGRRVGETDVDKFWYDTSTNFRGAYLLSRGLIRFNPDDHPATFITSSTLINEELTCMTAYLVSKASAAKLVQILNAEYSNLRTFAVLPGVVETEMLLDAFRPIAFDKPTLSAALSVWLCSPQADFLSGRYLDARWDMEQVVSRKDEIVKGDWLKLALAGY